MGKFETINIGDVAELSHVITVADIEGFVRLTGDDNRLHVDDEFAAGTEMKKPVVHGMLGASFISTVIGTKLPGDGALWFSQSLEFLLPVRVGDRITVEAEVLNKIPRQRIIEMRTDIFNQDKQKVTGGSARVMVIEQEVDQETDTASVSSSPVALVIGASGGIGAGVALRLAREGFGVALNYHSNKEGAESVRAEVEAVGGRAHLFKADVCDKRQVEGMVADVVGRFGGLSVLVNCATPKVPNIKFGDLEWGDIETHWDINIKGAFNLVKAVLPTMTAAKYGRIIHITTQYTEGTPPAEMLHYVTAKSALNGFSKSLAVDLAPKGITVNLVSPGMTDTQLVADVPKKAKLLTAARTPMKRLGKPEDIAAAVSFLAGAGAGFITGETIRVNGGQVML